ncbi:MAG: hypothetical protein AABY95_09515 [Pseudomonadota bacterium]
MANADDALGFLSTPQQDSISATACAAVPAITALRPPPAGAQAACVTHWWVCGGHTFFSQYTSKSGGSFTFSGQSQTNWGSATSACGPVLIVDTIGVEGRTVATDSRTHELKIQAEDRFDSFVGDSVSQSFGGAVIAQPCGGVSTHSAILFNARWSATAASGCANDRASDTFDIVDLLLQ